METVRIRDPGWKKVGSGINIRIRNTACGMMLIDGPGSDDGEHGGEPETPPADQSDHQHQRDPAHHHLLQTFARPQAIT